MAKHDQRILKFLNQNADRAPTITEMMTRLNISISEISDSLGSLLAQNLVAKRTNNQGIECWFPVGAGQPAQSGSQTGSIQQVSSHMQAPQTQSNVSQLVGDIRASAESRPLVDSRQMETRYMGGMAERPMQLPEAQPPASKPSPVHVQHIPMAERATSQTQSFPAMSGNLSASDMIGGTPSGLAPNYNYSQPASKGIGFLTFAVGLVLTVGFSTWLSGRLSSNEIHKAQKSFVDQKALTEATSSMIDFQGKTKLHIKDLEDQVKKLSDQLATNKAADSAKMAAVTPAKGAPVAKAAPAPKAEEPAPKTKAGKKAAIAKASKTAAVLAKAPAPKVKRKKASAHSSKSESSDASSSDEGSTSASSSSSASSASDASPSVPAAPGLDNQELPPPSAE